MTLFDPSKSLPSKEIQRDEFERILKDYQSSNLIYKYFLSYFGFKGSATMTALDGLLKTYPTQETFTQYEVAGKITNSGDRHYRHQLQLFFQPKNQVEAANGTGTDKVLVALEQVFNRSA